MRWSVDRPFVRPSVVRPSVVRYSVVRPSVHCPSSGRVSASSSAVAEKPRDASYLSL